MCRTKARPTAEFSVPWVSAGCTQEAYYNAAVQPVVTQFLEIANCDCGILAYGGTGSGKTFSTQVRARVSDIMTSHCP